MINKEREEKEREGKRGEKKERRLLRGLDFKVMLISNSLSSSSDGQLLDWLAHVIPMQHPLHFLPLLFGNVLVEDIIYYKN